MKKINKKELKVSTNVRLPLRTRNWVFKQAHKKKVAVSTLITYLLSNTEEVKRALENICLDG